MKLERVIGDLSFTMTSVLGRPDRTLLKPLYDKVNADPYTEILSLRGAGILSFGGRHQLGTLLLEGLISNLSSVSLLFSRIPPPLLGFRPP